MDKAPPPIRRRLRVQIPPRVLQIARALGIAPTPCISSAWGERRETWCWRARSPCRFAELGGGFVVGAPHVLQTVSMAHPSQASSLQGSHGVSCGILAVDDLATGASWQLSKQNQALLAVVGK